MKSCRVQAWGATAGNNRPSPKSKRWESGFNGIKHRNTEWHNQIVMRMECAHIGGALTAYFNGKVAPDHIHTPIVVRFHPASGRYRCRISVPGRKKAKWYDVKRVKANIWHTTRI